jgi:ABC-type lipoprotein export system ATPase subunit
MNSNIIAVKGVSKIYKDGSSEVTALDNISFSLDKGESVAIVGPSGSGKTTLLEIMGGLNTPTLGEVEVEGVNVHKGTDKEISTFRNKTMGFVFQMMHLQDYFNALENVTLPLIAAGVDKRIAEDKAMDLLKVVGLEDRAGFYPNQLSGGEMQRVAIARALSNSPKVIMADEPTAKLDRENSDKVMEVIMKIADKGVSVILITHDEKVASRFERTLIFDHGKLIKDMKD